MAETDLAGPHSRFREQEGVKVHYTVETPPSAASDRQNDGVIVAAHCYHGFGANTFSWSFAQVGQAHDGQVASGM